MTLVDKLPAYAPNSRPTTPVRFAVVDSKGFGHALPLRTILNQPLIADVSPQVVRMTFSPKQKRIDDGLRAPAVMDIQVHLSDVTTTQQLRQLGIYWHTVLQDARIFVTNEGTGVFLDPNAHDINASGPIQGKSAVVVAKLVPSDNQVYTIEGSKGFFL